MSRRTPCIEQAEVAECGLACLAMIAGHHGREPDMAALRRQHAVTLKGMTLPSVMKLAGDLQLSARALRLEPSQLRSLALPAILHWDMTHYVVLVACRADGGALLHDPATGARRADAAELDRHFSGVALELTPRPDFCPQPRQARLRLRDLLRSAHGLGGVLLQVLALSLVLQVYLLCSPFLMQLAVDGAVIGGDRGLLLTLALGFGLFAATYAGAGLLRSLLLVHVQARLAQVMGTALCGHLLRLPLAWFERRHTGDLVARFGSLEPIRSLLAEGMVAALVDGTMAVLTSALVVAYSPALAAIVLAALLAYAALRAAFYPAMRRRTQTSVLARARETSTLMETLRAIQTIKVCNAEAGRLALWSNRNSRALASNGAGEQLRAVFRFCNDMLFGIENVAVVCLGAAAVMDRRLSLGMLFAFVAYKQQFIERAVRLVDKAIELRMLDLHVERLADIALAEPETEPPLRPVPAVRGEIVARGLGFGYGAGAAMVFRDVSFRIAPGAYVAIAGASGCGKTTLLKVLLGLLPASEGTLLVDGVPLDRLGGRALRDATGVVMQDDTLLSGSIADNIALFDPRPDLDHVRACAVLACIDADIDAMPMGYETLVGDLGSVLSGGQRQRVLLARALYRRPRILVMDEGTSHLDPATEARVNAAVASLGLTRIVVAHRPQTLASAERVLLFEAGRLREPARLAEAAD